MGTPARLTRLSTLVVAAALALPASATALAPGQLFGFGDQDATGPAAVPTMTADGGAGEAFGPVDIYADKRIDAFKPTVTRFIANYDVARTPGAERDRTDAWYAVSLQNRKRMLIAFQDFRAGRPPTAAAFKRGLRAFKARYPKVTEWAPMNEANHVTQPTYRRPSLAVRYTMIAREVCPKCRIVQLTVVLGFENEIAYTRRFLQLLPATERRRLTWAVHTYSDTNRGRSTRLVRFLKSFPRGEIWFTESASWAQFAPPAWPYSPTRQARRTALIFRQAIAARRRVKRLYWYEWDGQQSREARWDSGLLDATGSPRPAYAVALRERFRRSLTRSQLSRDGLRAVADATRRR